MHIVNTIELKLIEKASDSKESLCEIQLNQKNTKIFIRGKVLEQAIWMRENRYLIFTTDEVVFEESLNIYLIDIQKGVLDKLWIGQPYNTDTFNGVQIINDHSLTFNFLYLKDWKLTIYDEPKLRLSIYSWLVLFNGWRGCRYLTLRSIDETMR